MTRLKLQVGQHCLHNVSVRLFPIQGLLTHTPYTCMRMVLQNRITPKMLFGTLKHGAYSLSYHVLRVPKYCIGLHWCTRFNHLVMTDGCLNKSLSPLNLIILLHECLALDGWIKGQVCVLWQGYSSPCSCQHFPRLLLSIRQWGKGHLIVLICMSEYQWGWMSPLPILLAICMSSFVNCRIQAIFYWTVSIYWFEK